MSPDEATNYSHDAMSTPVSLRLGGARIYPTLENVGDKPSGIRGDELFGVLQKSNTFTVTRTVFDHYVVFLGHEGRRLGYLVRLEG